MSQPHRSLLGLLPSPLHPLHRADRILAESGCEVLVKRDDLVGSPVAGNKIRALEYLIPAAQARGAELVVGAGSPTSNFIAALAQAVASAGMGCEILMPEPVHDSPTVRLALLAGARIRPVQESRHELEAAIERRVTAHTAEGVVAYGVPRGGASAVGALGFARAADELLAQLGSRSSVTIVLPVGSGGSVSGLMAGLAVANARCEVVGVSVSRPAAAVRASIEQLAEDCLDLLAPAHTTSNTCARLRLVDRTDGLRREDREIARAAYVHAGLIFDEHYGIPTLATAAEIVRGCEGGTVVVWHTGGIAALSRTLDQLESVHAVGSAL